MSYRRTAMDEVALGVALANEDLLFPVFQTGARMESGFEQLFFWDFGDACFPKSVLTWPEKIDPRTISPQLYEAHNLVLGQVPRRYSALGRWELSSMDEFSKPPDNRILTVRPWDKQSLIFQVVLNVGWTEKQALELLSDVYLSISWAKIAKKLLSRKRVIKKLRR